jgi:hypothetical protein
VASTLETEHGLKSVEGGRHPGWGTANWIVPLGDSYLELIAVVDEHEAASDAFGRWVAGASTPAGSPVGWAVRPDNFDETAARLELQVEEGSRTRPSGERIEWRSAGIDTAVTRPGLPFFIQWPNLAVYPGLTAAPMAAIARLEIACDTDELSAWLGDHSLPLDVRAGDAGVTAVVLDGPRGPITLAAKPGL